MNPADRARIVRRETAISVVINMAITAGFYAAVFGFAEAAPARSLAIDFLPHSFMVALMGSAVPAMILHNKLRGKAGRGAVMLRALIIALTSLVVAGGGAGALLLATGKATLGAAVALPLKLLFAAVLSVIVTPLAVRRVLSVPPVAAAA